MTTVIARIFSAAVNFLVNKKVVFRSKADNAVAVFQYAILSIFIMICSGGLVTALYCFTEIEEVLIKVVVDTCLFGLSFVIQREIVFKK